MKACSRINYQPSGLASEPENRKENTCKSIFRKVIKAEAAHLNPSANEPVRRNKGRFITSG
jgi:hypothetical protein